MGDGFLARSRGFRAAAPSLPLRLPARPATLAGKAHALPLLLALAWASNLTPRPDAAVSDAGQPHGEWEVVSVFVGKDDVTRHFREVRWMFAGPSVQWHDEHGRALGPLLSVQVHQIGRAHV